MTRDSDYYALSAEEHAEYYRAKRNKALSCNDGKCGGCPSCLEAQGLAFEDEIAETSALVEDDDEPEETEECPCCVAQRDLEAFDPEH